MFQFKDSVLIYQAHVYAVREVVVPDDFYISAVYFKWQFVAIRANNEPAFQKNIA